jgi:ssDNA-binding Zn-finger/Zn-ribbon topoisomerase 1
VPCPRDGGETVEKHSRTGKVFFGCANYPTCEWSSWHRPLPDPCPECGGVQVDMGRGRVRCLKHEGEPESRWQSKSTNGQAAKSASRNGATTRTVAAKRRNGAASKTAARPARRRAPASAA